MFIRRVSIVFGVGIMFIVPAYFTEFVMSMYGVPCSWGVSDFFCLLAGLFIGTHLHPAEGKTEESMPYLGEYPTLVNSTEKPVALLGETPRVEIPVMSVPELNALVRRKPR